MSELKYARGDERRYPHAMDVFEREVAENGFAAGWCMHAKPVPDYLFDAHVHYADRTGEKVLALVAHNAARAEALEVLRSLLIVRICGKEKPDLGNADEKLGDEIYSSQALKALLEGLEEDPRVVLAAWIEYLTPEAELVRAAKALGARCIKLHNSPIMEQAAPSDVWLSPPWQECFAAMVELKLPVLWHVTQRLPGCTYTGGDKNLYWREGWKKGITYGNEALLQTFLTCCQRNPGVNFIGAHQLHIGWERLDRLFAGYPNLHVDMTVGCRLRLDDMFYPHDQAYLRSVFIKWSERIVFGTDNFWRGKAGTDDGYNELMIREVLHFLTRLDLPEDALLNICHRNAERLMGLGSVVR